MEQSLEIRLFELLHRLRWLNNLRWLAIIIIVAVIEVTADLFSLVIHRFELYCCVGIMIAGNALLTYKVNNVFSLEEGSGVDERSRAAKFLASAQIIFDLVMLTLLIHFAGGVDNTFNYYYVFHIVIASMLLDQEHCFALAVFSCALYCGLIVFEHLGIVPHYPLYPALVPPATSSYYEFVKVLGVVVAFSSTILLTAYMATSISRRLRVKERLLLQTNMKLVDLDIKKSEFVMVVAHELKSPLGAIQFMLKSILSGFSGTLDPKAGEMITRAEQRTVNLLGLVNDLLDLSKIKTGFGTKEFKKVQLLDKLARAMELMAVHSREAGVEIRQQIKGAPEEFVVDGDPEYLENVFTNIVSNAVKYNKKGGTVDLSMERDGDFVVFRCADSGIGIPKDDLPKIFEEFHRTSISKKHTSNGTGVGMSIVKRIVEYHGGAVEVESEVGAGTRFTVKLPKLNNSVK